MEQVSISARASGDTPYQEFDETSGLDFWQADHQRGANHPATFKPRAIAKSGHIRMVTLYARLHRSDLHLRKVVLDHIYLPTYPTSHLIR
jgi:hypothetical protein